MTAVEENPTFTGFLKASGRTTTWSKSSRQRLNEIRWAELQTYNTSTLIANWNEDKYDVRNVSKRSPLPSQYDHYYVTTYRRSYAKAPMKPPDVLRFSPG